MFHRSTDASTSPEAPRRTELGRLPEPMQEELKRSVPELNLRVAPGKMSADCIHEILSPTQSRSAMRTSSAAHRRRHALALRRVPHPRSSQVADLRGRKRRQNTM
jgi:hypothetical protein